MNTQEELLNILKTLVSKNGYDTILNLLIIAEEEITDD